MNAKNVMLSSVSGVGKKTLDKLKSVDIYNAEDLLLYWPKKYMVYEPMTLDKAGMQIGYSCIVGRIISRIQYVYYNPRLSRLVFDIDVLGEKVHVVIFNRTYLMKVLKANSYVKLYGKYNKYKKEIIVNEIFPNMTKGHIETDYKIPELNNKSIKKIINTLIDADVLVEEYLPEYCLNKYQFVPVNKMIKMLHNPDTLLSVYEARRRKKYEEVLEFYLQINYYKRLISQNKRDSINYDIKKVKELIKTIPFELTPDQKTVTNQIFLDFKKDIPMNRIIEGDVGSGKTIVSLIASYALITAKKQVILMAPTEILAKQHLSYFNHYLSKFGVKTELLVSSIKGKSRLELLEKIKNGDVDIIIGTHALFYEDIIYHDLGLAIIDEQHRFGVDARNKLLQDHIVDSLYLSATPIPRTLALTLFQDLDLSVLKTVRSDKLPIKTEIMKNTDIEGLIKRIKPQIEAHHQGYIVVSKIEADMDSNRYDLDTVKALIEQNLSGIRIGIIHGKLKDKEKDDIMNAFLNKEYDILISTTVIEVGISVDNATFIAIFDSQNFGLSTLHQLRGRVGRANLQGYCYLLTDDMDILRLHVLEESNDGFYLAEQDLKMRGPGEYFGYKQSGIADFVFANFDEDYELFKYVNNDAKTLLLLEENDKKTYEYIQNIIRNLNIENKLN